MKVMSIMGATSLKCDKDKKSTPFNGNYVTGFKPEKPLSKKQIDFVVKVAKKALVQTFNNANEISDKFTNTITELLTKVASEESSAVKQNMLSAVEQKLRQEPIKFSEEHIAKIKEIYSNDNSSFLNDLLVMKSDSEIGALRFKDPDMVVHILLLHKKAPDAVENIVNATNGWEPGFAHNTCDIIKRIMESLPPGDSEKKAFFAHLNPEETIKELYKLNHFEDHFTMKDAEDLAYRVYGIKLP